MGFKMWNLRCGAAAVLMGSAAALFAQEPGMQVSGFRVPEYNSQGEMTSQLFGDEAEILGTGEIKISELRVEFYQEESVFLEVTSPYCFYDRGAGQAHSDAPVAAVTDQMRLSGTGFVLEAEDRTVQLLDDSRVEIEEITSRTGGATDASATNLTVITSERLFLDYFSRSALFEEHVQVDDPRMTGSCETMKVVFTEDNAIQSLEACGGVEMRHDRQAGSASSIFAGVGKGDEEEAAEPASELQTVVITSPEFSLDLPGQIARFSGGVEVRDPELTMDCNELAVHFGEENEISWIEALGEVTMLYEGRKALAGKAVYNMKTGEMILEDDPKILQERNMICAETIRFLRDSGEMICEPRARLVMYPDGKIKTDLFGK